MAAAEGHLIPHRLVEPERHDAPQRLDADAVSRLPELLGGEASNDLLMPCPPFSKHDRADLESCGEPVFVHEVPLEATFM